MNDGDQARVCRRRHKTSRCLLLIEETLCCVAMSLGLGTPCYQSSRQLPVLGVITFI